MSSACGRISLLLNVYPESVSSAASWEDVSGAAGLKWMGRDVLFVWKVPRNSLLNKHNVKWPISHSTKVREISYIGEIYQPCT